MLEYRIARYVVTASARELTPSFVNRLWAWFFTVWIDTLSRDAIC